ncbi:MAG: aldehyde dehydrogenase family protein [Puniceicoccaceae bacterium]|jgi:aldehyde dehydrogenase (NAD+)|nr:aldehyde dehydrogenase family protein [Puniceicoccaceae bacterium]MBL6920170.1 aldehyde dehydrogenase family protein [Puniceicoccaceae bacterium]
MKVTKILETMDYGTAPESSAVALKWIEERGADFGLFINGAFVKPAGRESFATHNPANNELLAKLCQAQTADVDAAVSAARGAQAGWESMGGSARSKYLYAIARLVQKHSRLFAVLETLDNGKPIRESRDIDVPLVARHFYFHAGAAVLMADEMPDHQALGVAAQVIPWNFPLLMLAWKIAPALAMGNTVVLKPAEYTSLTALLFAEICQEAGLPNGVVNILTGNGSVGEQVVIHPDVDKVAFTGSTAVGRHIRQAIAGQGKAITLELGGKSPYIVFDDADIDSAVEGLVDAIWLNQGQVCCAGSRLFVQEGVAEVFHRKLRSRMDKLRIGDPMDKSIDIGAIVDPVQLQSIKRLVDEGLEEGGNRHVAAGDCPSEGSFYPPTFISEVDPACRLMQEEIFGPVLVGSTFRTPAEAVALANNTRYGLAASIWTENINLALDLAPKIVCGVAWINTTNQFDAAAGFGGCRESGFGREGGWEGLYAYVRPSYQSTGEIEVITPPQGSSETVEGSIDRTPKLFIAGRQVRPDSGYSTPVYSSTGQQLGLVGQGNRKDIRNAVEAAHAARSWAKSTAHLRAQILYYIAENLSVRREEFAQRITAMTGAAMESAKAEVDLSIDRLFIYAAWADKYDGAAHGVPIRGVALAMHEPVGIIGMLCSDQAPLLGMVSVLAPAIAMGNTCVVVPSQAYPLAATDLYQVLETSDLPAGVVNIVTAAHSDVVETMAGHMEVDALWYFGADGHSASIERASVTNLKRTWVNNGRSRDWQDTKQGAGKEFLRQATEVKNIWIPYGE